MLLIERRHNVVAPAWSAFLFLSVAAFSAYFVSATEECHSYDEVCDIQVATGNALSAFRSWHDNSKEDRIWTFYDEAVPFATSTTYTTGYVNEWDGDASWSSTGAYMVGWYSYHDNGKEDRRFNIYYRNLATGYTRGSCAWTGFNDWDESDALHEGQDDSYVFGMYSYHDDFHEDRKTKFYFCTVIAPSPPPPPPLPPPPSPPPPSPPPPGSHGVPIVTIGVASSKVTSSEFDFKIKVADDDCSGYTSDCLGSITAVTQSTAAGLHCDVVVADTSDSSCSLATAGDYLPCK